MRQILLRIKLPRYAEPLRPNEFRELLARGSGDSGLPLKNAFFSYDEHGQPMQGRPEIRLVGGKQWIGVLGSDEDSLSFHESVGTVLKITATHFGCPLEAQIERMRYHLEPSSSPITYFFRDVAFKRKSSRTREASTEDLLKNALLGERGSNTLATEAVRCGFDLPTDDELGFEILSLRTCGVSLNVSGVGDTKQWMHVANGKFQIRARLHGMWQIGALQSRGFGRLIYEIPDRVIDEEVA